MTSIKRTNIDEEVQFERRHNEISKSTDDVQAGLCTLIKDLWNFKLYFILSILAIIALGVFPPFQGLIVGKSINGLNSNYQTVRYDEALKYSIIYLIVSFAESIVYFFTYWVFII